MANKPFTPQEDALVISLRGQMTAANIGQQIGRSADAVKRRWRNLGLTGTKPSTKKAEPKLVARSDAELIQLHLQTRGVTVCPPAPACGITALEAQTGFTAQPQASLSYREKHHQIIQAAKRRAAA